VLYYCSGLRRSKTTEDESFSDGAAAAADKLRRIVENPAGESPGEQNSGNFLTTAANGNLRNRPKTDATTQHSETAISGVAPKLQDPFDFHVYVGFSPENHVSIKLVIDTLKTRWNLLCCYSEIADKMKEEGQIEHLIARSEKCLLYVTPEYIRESWSRAEVTAAVDKARRFSRNMLLVLKDSQLSAKCLNDLDLQEFPMTDWISVGDNALPDQVELWLLHTPIELVPIPQLPEKISGYYEALVYYFGFLTMVLRDHRQKMKSVVESWSKDVRSGAKVVFPMLIVVPESCRAPRTFHVEGKLVTPTSPEKYIVTAIHRAGCVSRDYKMPVVQLVVDAEKNDVVYFSGEFPACLLTVYETGSQMGMTKVQLDKIRTDFCRTLQSLLSHPDNRHCIDQYRLVLWPDDRVDLYDFLFPVVRSAAEEGDASSLVVYGPQRDGSQLPKSSFYRLESSNINLCTVKGGSPPYVMRDVSPRGICLIINISDVTPTPIDVRQLHRLFSEQFDFDVDVHSYQMTSDDLDVLLSDVAEKDHSRYDAFVCYIASRGRLGGVCTSDGICKLTVNLVNIINDKNCQTLRGKPKLYLIQMTDDGTTEDLVFNNNETQVHYFLCTVYIRPLDARFGCVKLA